MIVLSVSGPGHGHRFARCLACKSSSTQARSNDKRFSRMS